jgi:hypothetical protein
MKTHILAGIALSVLSVITLSGGGFAQAPKTEPPKAEPAKSDPKAAAPATEDVIYMRDGRILHGQILSEMGKLIVFEYHDQALKLKTRMNLPTEDIIEIERDVALAAAPGAGE